MARTEINDLENGSRFRGYEEVGRVGRVEGTPRRWTVVAFVVQAKERETVAVREIGLGPAALKGTLYRFPAQIGNSCEMEN